MRSRVAEAIDAPPCPTCGAWAGDPCRRLIVMLTPPVTEMHAARRALMAKP